MPDKQREEYRELKKKPEEKDKEIDDLKNKIKTRDKRINDLISEIDDLKKAYDLLALQKNLKPADISYPQKSRYDATISKTKDDLIDLKKYYKDLMDGVYKSYCKLNPVNRGDDLKTIEALTDKNIELCLQLAAQNRIINYLESRLFGTQPTDLIPRGPGRKKKISVAQISIIKDALRETDLSYSQIADLASVSKEYVAKICKTEHIIRKKRLK